MPTTSLGTAPPAVLTFNFLSSTLSGLIDPSQRAFSLPAVSGGSRGHLSVGRGPFRASPQQGREYRYFEARLLKSQLANTAEVKDSRGRYLQRGGPIPPGNYSCHYVSHHPPFVGPVIALTPMRGRDGRLEIRSPFASTTIYLRRGGFYIHGSGPKGSDGCIVIAKSPERDRLFREIYDYELRYQPAQVTLRVIGVPYELPAENYEGMRA
jgi:hypothetical protein